MSLRAELENSALTCTILARLGAEFYLQYTYLLAQAGVCWVP